jgi:hypothetical protein
VDASANWVLGTGNLHPPPFEYNDRQKQDAFGLNAVELSLSKEPDRGWSAGYRCDLVVGPDGQTLDQSFGSMINIKEAYVDLNIPLGNGVELRVGRFDTIIGYEYFESGRNPNYSRSYGYTLDTAQHTGVLASYPVTDFLDVSVGVANALVSGFINQRSLNGDTDVAWMGALRLKAPEDSPMAGSFLSGGIVRGFGTQGGEFNSAETQMSYYAGATLVTPLKWLRLGMALDVEEHFDPAGFRAGEDLGHAEAYAAYLSVQPTRRLGLHTRAEWADTFFLVEGEPFRGARKVFALTETLQFDLWKDVISRLEVRWDHAADGRPLFGGAGFGPDIPPDKKNSVMIAANFIYNFSSTNSGIGIPIPQKETADLPSLPPPELSGYVDTSAQWNPGTGNAHTPNFAYGNGKADGFNLNVVALKLARPLAEPETWSSGYGVDLLFGPDANTFPRQLSGAASDFAFKQAYVAARVPLGRGLDFKMGVFDKLMGQEVFDAGENPNFTRSYGYTIEPTTHTGVLASYSATDWLGASFGVANRAGSTINAPVMTRAESFKTYLGEVWVRAPEDWHWLSNAFLSAGALGGDQTSFFVGARVPTPLQRLHLGACCDYASVPKTGFSEGISGYAAAAAGYASYQVTDKLSLHARGEYAWCNTPAFFDPLFGPAKVFGANKVIAATGTVEYDLWRNVISRLEFRWDHAADGSTPYGGAAANPGDLAPGDRRNSYLVAANFIYNFSGPDSREQGSLPSQAAPVSFPATTLGGYVDTSAQVNFGTWHDHVPAYAYGGPSKANGFNLNVAELTLRPASAAETGWSDGYRVDLLFGPDANTFGSVSSSAGSSADFAVKQACLDLVAPLGNGLDFKLGVWDKLIGYEVFESANNPNFTRSYGYSIEPTTHTGLLASYRFSDLFAVSAGVANTLGPKINERASPPKAESYKAYMGALTITAPACCGFLAGSTLEGGVVNGFNSFTATRQPADQTSWYAGASLATPVKGLTWGVAYDYAGVGSQPLSATSSYANDTALYLSLQATERLSFRTRGEYAASGTPRFGASKIFALTETAQYDLWKNVVSRLELRWDHAADGSKPYGGGALTQSDKKNSVLAVASLVYRF